MGTGNGTLLETGQRWSMASLVGIAKALPVFLGILAVLYTIARPHAENLILQTVDGRALKLENSFRDYRVETRKATDAYRREQQTKDEKQEGRANTIITNQAVIQEGMRRQDDNLQRILETLTRRTP